MNNRLKILALCLVFLLGAMSAFSQERNSEIHNESSADDQRSDEYNFADYSGLEFAVGGTYLLDKEIDEDLNWGPNIGLRMRFDMPGGKISVAPHANVRGYTRSSKNFSSIDYSLSIYKVGLQLSGLLYSSTNDKLSLWGFIELNKSWLTYNLRHVDKNDDPFDGGTEILGKESIFSGEAVTGMIGGRLRYGIFFLEAAYDSYFSSMIWGDSRIEYYTSKGIDYDPYPEYFANGLILNIGFYLPFGKMEAGSYGYYPGYY